MNCAKWSETMLILFTVNQDKIVALRCLLWGPHSVKHIQWLACNDYSVNVRTSLSCSYRFTFLFFHIGYEQILTETTFNSWKISEVSSFLITIPNQLCKAGPHEFSMSIQNKKNTIRAKN